MPDVRYELFDTWQPSTTANAESILFQVPTGGDSTHTEVFTNMRGAGSLPSTEKMKVDRIKVTVDKALPIADLTKWFYASILEFKLADVSLLKAPVSFFIAHTAFGGTPVEATAADTPTIGLLGLGYMLDIPIDIGGGVPFKVRLVQGLALSATTNIKVVLGGIYSLATPAFG